MQFVTVVEIKDLLGITDTSRDAFIEANKSSVEKQFFEETNNYFEVSPDVLFLSGNSIAFVSGTPAKITDSENRFVSAGFKAGMDIRIQNSILNNGIFRVGSVVPGELTLAAGEVLIDEDLSQDILVTLVVIPEQIKLVIAKIIEFYFPTKNSQQGIKSEKFDDYSISFVEKGEGFPASVQKLIEPYMNLKWD